MLEIIAGFFAGAFFSMYSVLLIVNKKSTKKKERADEKIFHYWEESIRLNEEKNDILRTIVMSIRGNKCTN